MTGDDYLPFELETRPWEKLDPDDEDQRDLFEFELHADTDDND